MNWPPLALFGHVANVSPSPMSDSSQWYIVVISSEVVSERSLRGEEFVVD